MLQNIRKRGITTFRVAGGKKGKEPETIPGIDPFCTEIPFILIETTNYLIKHGIFNQNQLHFDTP